MSGSVKAPKSAKTPADQASPNLEPRPSLLIVDDEKRMVDSLRRLFNDEGYQVRCASDTDSAIEALDKGRYDTIVTDVRMPGGGGHSLLARSIERDPELPVILMTAFGSLESAVEAIALGAYDYVLKPVDFADLSHTVRRAVEKRRLYLSRQHLLEELREKNEQLSHRVAELNALHQAGDALSTTRELEPLLESITTLAVSAVGARRGSVMLLDEPRNNLIVAASVGAPSRADSTGVPVGESIAGWVAERGEPVLIENVETDQRFQHRNRPGFATSSAICAPLRTPQRILGVINLADKHGDEPFELADLHLLETLAAQAAVAIEDNELYNANRQKLAEITALHEVVTGLESVSSTEEMARVAFQGLQIVAHSTDILWWEWENNGRSLRLVTCLKHGIPAETIVAEFPSLKLNQSDAGSLDIQLINSLKDTDCPHSLDEAMLTIPVRSTESPFGVFTLHRSPEDDYTTHESRIAHLVAMQAATLFERRQAALNASRLMTMGKLISEISHDLRRPLTNIRGSLQVLAQRVGESGDSAEIFQSIDQEILRLTDLVKELVSFSDPKKYHTERRDLTPTLLRCADLARSEAQRKNVEVSTEIDGSLPQIFCDKNQITEALLNLLLNALDAIESETGGHILLTACRGEDSKPGGTRSTLVVEISDNGKGIPKSELPRIFGRHYTTKETGTGLGLAVVERVVQAHDGRIEVDSEPGKGTTFRLIFPIR